MAELSDTKMKGEMDMQENQLKNPSPWSKAKVLWDDNLVNAGHPDWDNANEADSFASDNNMRGGLWFTQGEYELDSSIGSGSMSYTGINRDNVIISVDGHNSHTFGMQSFGGFIISNLTIRNNSDDRDAIRSDREGGVIRNVVIEQATGASAIRLDGDRCSVINCEIEDASSSNGVWIRGEESRVIGVNCHPGTNRLNVSGDNSVVTASQCDRLYVSGTETIVSATIIRDSIEDWGTRNIINGRSVNDGDPRNGGDWEGDEDYAEMHNAIIEDTVNNNLYMVVGGSFVQIN